MTSDIFLNYVKKSSSLLCQVDDKPVYVTYVPPLLLQLIKPELLNLLKKLDDISNGKQTAEDIFNSCNSNKYTTWCIVYDTNIVGVATTEIKKYPRSTAFYVSNISVDRNIFQYFRIEFKNFFESTAIKMGCDLLEFIGRAGWSKWTVTEGFSNKLYLYTKKLQGVEIV